MPPVYGKEYRQALCDAKLGACFLSKWNGDEYTRRVFEIPACGVMLLAERTRTMESLFKEGRDAECFGSAEEPLDYNLLFRWFVGLNMDDPIWDVSVFTKNRDRLLQGDVAQAFFEAVTAEAHVQGLLSAEHFTVDGTLLAAWASHKSVRPKDAATPPPTDDDPGNPTVDFRGERRTNATHQSTTDPDAQLVRKSRGQAAILGYRGHVLMENRSGLVVRAEATRVVGASELATALALATAIPGDHRVTVGGDKGYDTAGFVTGCRALGITPHGAQNITARHPSAIDARTTRHPGYAGSQRCRKRVEEVFGLAEAHRAAPQTPPLGPRLGQLDLRVADDRLQPDPDAQSPGERRLSGAPRAPRAPAGARGRCSTGSLVPSFASGHRLTSFREGSGASGASFSTAC